MKYFPLLWASLWRKPLRTFFTFVSVVAAFVLFGIMGGINASYQTMMAASRMDRLVTYARERGVDLPITYDDQLKAIPGVKLSAPMSVVPAYFRDEKNFVGVDGIDE